MYKKTLLINEKGIEFQGYSLNSFKPSTGELIFNTAMTGFVEIISDPSYVNQLVTFTSSHIGNYGMTKEDLESEEPRISGLITRSLTSKPSSWRSQQSLTDWLNNYSIPYSWGFDVRSITKHLRESGSSTFALGQDIESKELLSIAMEAKSIIGDDSALTAGVGELNPRNCIGKIGILDLGSKNSIDNIIRSYNLDTIRLSPELSADKILSLHLKGLIISNGPGDPRSLVEVTKTVKQLLGKLPIFGICLGHQLLGLAVGINVEKLSFGHHGSNHPVKVEGFDNALITAQNHGFTLENIKKTINHEEYGEINQFATNLNDGSNEGLSIWESNAYSVQFHPESGPGPSDGKKVFEPFITLIENSED